MNIETLLDQVVASSNGNLEEAEVRLLLLEEQRRRVKHICYWDPIPDQLQFWSDRIYERKVWLIAGGERSGKTAIGAFLSAAWVLGKEYFRGEPAWKWVEPLPIPDWPSSVRAIGLSEDVIRNSIWEKMVGATEHPPMLPSDGTVTTHDGTMQAESKNGGKFHVKSAEIDPKKHGAVSVDLAWIDEECSFDIMRMNEQRTVSKEGKILITATPFDDVGTAQHPWIFDYIQRWREGDTEIGVMFLDSLNNPHTSDEEKRRMMARFGGTPEEQSRIHGIPTRRSGLYYPMWKPVKPLWIPPCLLPGDAYRVLVIDPATTGPVGAVWIAYHGRKQTVYRDYKAKGLTVSEHVQNLIADTRGEPIDLVLMEPWMGRQRVPSVGDEHKTVLQLWRDAGLPRARLADADYERCLAESREYLQAAFDPMAAHDSTEVFDTCSHFRNEIERYVVDAVAQGSRRGEMRDRPRKGNDDVLNAWQVACGMRLRPRRPEIRLVEPRLRCHTSR